VKLRADARGVIKKSSWNADRREVGFCARYRRTTYGKNCGSSRVLTRIFGSILHLLGSKTVRVDMNIACDVRSAELPTILAMTVGWDRASSISHLTSPQRQLPLILGTGFLAHSVGRIMLVAVPVVPCVMHFTLPHVLPNSFRPCDIWFQPADWQGSDEPITHPSSQSLVRKDKRGRLAPSDPRIACSECQHWGIIIIPAVRAEPPLAAGQATFAGRDGKRRDAPISPVAPEARRCDRSS
jgi:hypothetical protein